MAKAREVLQSQRWIAQLPLVACVITVSTYLFCIIFAVAKGTYIGSIPFPYFSDTGRDPPAYFVFATFLTIVALIFLPVQYFMHFAVLQPAIAALGDTQRFMKCEAVAGSLFGVLSAPFLAILSIFDTAFHADLHLYSAYLFFILNVISIVIFDDLFRRIKNGMELKADVSPNYWRRTFRTKLGVSIFFFIAFLFYIPIGLAVNCEMLRLPLSDCKGKYGLGEKYCDDRLYKVENGTALTVLYDYSQGSVSVHSDKCVNLNTMRSVSQFFSIVGLLLYVATFTIDLKEAADTSKSKLPIVSPVSANGLMTKGTQQKDETKVLAKQEAILRI